MFSRQYGAKDRQASSIFVLSEPINFAVAAVQYCEHALDILLPAEFTIDRMSATIENSLTEICQKQPGATMLVGLYSPLEQQYSAFRTGGVRLKEFAGYDCQGSAAFLGHYLIRDRYRAIQSMDTLDLRSVLAIAAEALDGIWEFGERCGGSAEILALYADGRMSGVEHLWRGRRELPESALSANRAHA